ncbi:hypothetical protein NT239_16195 [Chitinibacter sp. SCUT-21]|uniref:hypothetical protein n=1 Tax=Chitinibacter sp. SCUT-21 TaxID=2970891 RepID=UPI0035A6DA90
MKIFRFLLLASLVLSIGLGAWHLHADRASADQELVAVFNSLPHPKISTQYSETSFFGEYYSRSTYIKSRYQTTQNGIQVCQAFEHVIHQNLGMHENIEEKTECVPRYYGKSRLYTIHQRKAKTDKSWTAISIVIDDKNSYSSKNTTVKISIVHTFDKKKWNECTPENPLHTPFYCGFGWSRRIEPFQIGKTAHLESSTNALGFNAYRFLW